MCVCVCVCGWGGTCESAHHYLLCSLGDLCFNTWSNLQDYTSNMYTLVRVRVLCQQ